MESAHTIGLFRGPEITPWMDEVARLRVAVFRDWPYLYEGDLEHEQRYLSAYASSPESLFVLALAGGAVVGASTGLPLADDTEAFQKPFLGSAFDPDEVFYFGESVLLPGHRGRGIGHAFFDHREAHARALGRFRWTAFCSVDRDPCDPRRPRDARTHDAFWRQRGYQRQPGMTMQLAWDEIGHGEIEHDQTFWMRPLEARA